MYISSLHPLEKLLNVNNTETKQGLGFLCLQLKDCGKCVFTSQSVFQAGLFEMNVEVGNTLPYKGM